MRYLSILEPEGGAIASTVSALLERAKSAELLTAGISVTGVSFLAGGARADLLVVSARETIRNPGAESCGVLLIPERNRGFAAGIRAGFVVSYGMSERDSVTFSSLEGGSFLLSIQRELPTLDGAVLERQDIPVRIPGRAAPEDAMAAAAALVIAGLDPEALGKRR